MNGMLTFSSNLSLFSPSIVSKYLSLSLSFRLYFRCSSHGVRVTQNSEQNGTELLDSLAKLLFNCWLLYYKHRDSVLRTRNGNYFIITFLPICILPLQIQFQHIPSQSLSPFYSRIRYSLLLHIQLYSIKTWIYT